MKCHLFFTLLVSLLLTGTAAAQATAPGPDTPQARLGINLNGPSDWNTELPFVDVFRLSRSWISQKEGADWGEGPSLELDEHGWVKRLDEGSYAETPLCTISGGHYPAGRYTVLYDGEGKIEFWGAATVVEQEPERMVIDVNPEKGGFFLRLSETNPQNYVRNIRVIMPGFEESYQQNPFHPVFLNRWKGFAALRFMDWMHTNGSDVQTWDDRPKVDDATWTHGIPLEVMIDLANRLKIDPWFCMPHLADDDYVRRFASMVQEKLDPSLTAYVEYSNEVWNGQFAQSRYAGERGMGLGLGEKPWEAGWRYYARRSVEIFDIWREVFGEDKDRVVRVLATQAANPYVAKQIVSFEDAGHKADALGIAPYISLNVRPGGDPGVEQVSQWSVDQVLDHLQNQSLPKSIEHKKGNKKVADEYGLQLVCYEAGQHAVGVGGGENNKQMTALFHEANRHPRMGEIYKQYYNGWEETGGGLMAVFSSVGRWSKWGSWGLIEYYDQHPTEVPKYQATLEWAAAHGQDVTMDPASAAADQ